MLYAIVNPDDENLSEVSIIIVGTGHPFDEPDSSWTFMGTHSMENGSLMWHVWQKVLREI